MTYSMSTSVSVIIRAEDKARLIELAQTKSIDQRQNFTVSRLIREAVEEYLEQHETAKEEIGG